MHCRNKGQHITPAVFVPLTPGAIVALERVLGCHSGRYSTLSPVVKSAFVVKILGTPIVSLDLSDEDEAMSEGNDCGARIGFTQFTASCLG
jgi:hypothetical protein